MTSPVISTNCEFFISITFPLISKIFSLDLVLKKAFLSLDQTASIISFIYMYLVIFFLLSALLSLTGLDFITAISGAATSISNVGPGLGSIIGPNGNFSTLPDVSKWILTIGMILGRLELFAILVLFLPSFWRN